MCLITAYVAVGLAAGPIGLLCGYKDPREELNTVRNRRSGVEIEIAAIQEIRNVLHNYELLVTIPLTIFTSIFV